MNRHLSPDARDDLHGPVARHDVHQLQPRARGRALRRRRRRPRAPAVAAALRARLARDVPRAARRRRRRALPRRTCARARPRSAGASSSPRRRTRARSRRVRGARGARHRRARCSCSTPAPRSDARERDELAALGVEFVDPAADPALRRRADERLLARRGEQGADAARRPRRSPRTPLFFADALVALGEADGCVAGAVHTTARRRARGALDASGRRPGVRTVSSAFYMVVPALPGQRGAEVLTFTDCAVVPVSRPPRSSPTSRSPRPPTAGASSATSRASRSSRSARKASGEGAVVELVRRGARARARRARRGSPWTENCKVTPRSSAAVARAQGAGQRGRRAARTCSSSPRSTPATSATSWCSGSPGAARGRADHPGAGPAVQRSLARRRRRGHYQRRRDHRAAGGRAAQRDGVAARLTSEDVGATITVRTRADRETEHELHDQEAGRRRSWWTWKASSSSATGRS